MGRLPEGCLSAVLSPRPTATNGPSPWLSSRAQKAPGTRAGKLNQSERDDFAACPDFPTGGAHGRARVAPEMATDCRPCGEAAIGRISWRPRPAAQIVGPASLLTTP